jgi:hypothetical protein
MSKAVEGSGTTLATRNPTNSCPGNIELLVLRLDEESDRGKLLSKDPPLRIRLKLP